MISLITKILSLSILLGLQSHSFIFTEMKSESVSVASDLPNEATGLFQIINPDKQSTTTNESFALRSRIVSIVPSQLERIRDISNQEAITLNLFEDLVLIANFDKRYQNTSGSTTWMGRLRQHPDSHVLLVIKDDLLHGTISVPSIGTFSIQSQTEGTHLILQRPPLDESSQSDSIVPPKLN